MILAINRVSKPYMPSDTSGFSKLLNKEVILARIVPCVRDLSQDSSQHV
jgi:serine/threonine-protein phosphatase 2A regulatory subunit A